MKILHICLASFYIDNFTYQENILTKFHKEMGYDVEILASLVSFNEDGELIELNDTRPYINEHGISVKRLSFKKGFRTLRRYKETYNEISKSNPDIIFIHGCQFLDIDKVKKYKRKNKHVKIYIDNHADFGNSAKNWISKYILHKVFWKYSAKTIEKHTEKFYGVLPARVKFLNIMYNIPLNKIELLLMGADDEEVQKSTAPETINNTRKSLKVNKNDFLIVTGGKIGKDKMNVFNLIKAVKELNVSNLKLVVFGSVTKELKKEMENLCNANIQHIGWADSELSSKLLGAADLVVFPDKHSVFWEQTVALGIPLLVSNINGTNHIDIGGNTELLYESSQTEIKNKLNTLAFKDNIEYKKMKENAQKSDKSKFLYSNIARKSIQ